MRPTKKMKTTESKEPPVEKKPKEAKKQEEPKEEPKKEEPPKEPMAVLQQLTTYKSFMNVFLLIFYS